MLPKRKKVAPKGAYDQNYIRCIKKTGKWRGKTAGKYTKYKSVKKPREESVIINDQIVVPKNCYRFSILDWGKIIYKSKEQV